MMKFTNSLLRSKLEQEWKEDSINKPDSSSINKKKTQLDPTILSIIFSIIFFLGLGLGIHLFLGNTITSSNSSQERKESLKETVITSERSQESQTSPKDLFAGKYKTNYIMKVRAQPNYEGNQIGRKEEGVTFEITKSVEGPNNSIWGQLPEGGWICLKDADLVYTTKIGS